VERLIQYVKRNMLAGMTFYNITDLNESALEWCARQGGRYRKAVDCVPHETHSAKCLPACHAPNGDVKPYLYPTRTISFDGFVSFESRRFGVPYWYPGRVCRAGRDGSVLRIFDEDLSRELATHPVTWSRKDSWCEDQYADTQPEEHPTAPVTTTIRQLAPGDDYVAPAFRKFDFGGTS